MFVIEIDGCRMGKREGVSLGARAFTLEGVWNGRAGGRGVRLDTARETSSGGTGDLGVVGPLLLSSGLGLSWGFVRQRVTGVTAALRVSARPGGSSERRRS